MLTEKEKEDNRKKEITKRKKMLRELEKSLNGFNSTQFAFTNDYTKEILFDSVKKMVGIIDSNKNFGKKYRIDQIVSVERLDPIKIKITVDDKISPIHIFEFISGKVERNSFHYKNTVKRVNHWHDLLENPMKFIGDYSQFNRRKTKLINQQQETEKTSGLIGCLTLIVMFFLFIVLVSSCADLGGSNYQPGDFDFDGDSGDFDDAVKFTEWKINQDR